MKTIKDIIKLKAVRYTALILGGFLLGWAFLAQTSPIRRLHMIMNMLLERQNLKFGLAQCILKLNKTNPENVRYAPWILFLCVRGRRRGRSGRSQCYSTIGGGYCLS